MTQRQVLSGDPAPEFARRPAVLRIGRDLDNGLVVDDLLVSRSHAEFRDRGDNRFEIVDLGSHNGTFVNGRRVQAEILTELDFVTFGRTSFRFTGSGLEPYRDTAAVGLAVLGVTVASGDVTLVHDVSFPLRSGTLTAIVGPSGAGKSSLLGALTGQRQPVSGSVFFGGRDLRAEFSEIKHFVGFVPQDDIVHPELTVGQSLEYAAELRFAPDVTAHERRTRIHEVLRDLDLVDRRDVQVKRLSGGERKRVSVALELLTRPTLLLLDEPTSGLDPGLERNLMELFRRLADGGRIVITVTHSVDSLRLCDRLLFLAPGGRVAYFGPPQLSPSYFEREDYQEIFRDLSEGDPEDWRTRFAADELSARYVTEPLLNFQPTPRAATAAVREDDTRQRWLRQVAMLTRRNVRITAADHAAAAMMIGAAPLLGLLALWRLPGGELARLPGTEVRLVSQAALVIFVVMLSMTLLGFSNGIREISKELPIVRRELSVGLSASAYVAAKFSLLALITVAQAAVLVPIALFRQDLSGKGLFLRDPLIEILLAAALAGVASLALALFVSATFRSTSAALAFLPLLLAFQVLFGSRGVFPDAAGRPLVRELSYVSSTGWAFAGAAATVDLNELQRVNNVAARVQTLDLTDPEPAISAMYDPDIGNSLFNHERVSWYRAGAILCGFIAAVVVATTVAVQRLRPA